jgi:hypothetical protein
VLSAAATQGAATAKVAHEVAAGKDASLMLALSAVGLTMAGALYSIERKLRRR